MLFKKCFKFGRLHILTVKKERAALGERIVSRVASVSIVTPALSAVWLSLIGQRKGMWR